MPYITSSHWEVGRPVGTKLETKLGQKSTKKAVEAMLPSSETCFSSSESLNRPNTGTFLMNYTDFLRLINGNRALFLLVVWSLLNTVSRCLNSMS